jgi:periplasmic copper chaperone A
MKKIYLLLLLLVSSSVFAEVANEMMIEGAFVRPALKQQRNTALYMQLTNHGSDATIVSASSDAAKVVELHTHVNDNGVMRMRKIDKIELPAGQQVMLKPGGLHIMFIGLNRDLNVDGSVDVTLEFSDGSKKSVSALITRARTMPGMKGHADMKHGS